MKRRIFVAITISERFQREISEWETKYRELPVRWLAGKNLHITLVPPWYEEDVNKVIKKLAIGKLSDPLEIRFTKVDFGPNPRRPRLIWAEGETGNKILEMRDKITEKLDIRSEKLEQRTDRPFKTHLTLARFRPETFSSFSVKRLSESVDWRDDVGSFVLMESHLSREGADYEVLQKFNL